MSDGDDRSRRIVRKGGDSHSDSPGTIRRLPTIHDVGDQPVVVTEHQPGPHQGQSLESAGTPIEEAGVAVVLVHGRGATARSILGMAESLPRQGVSFLAPQAAGNTWYPNPFTAPVHANEPGITSGVQAIAEAIDEAVAGGVALERVVIMGFSQGACLASEYVARNPTRYGGLAVLSGGLIGQTVDRADYAGDLDRTPVFLGCSDSDPHIAEERVHETAAVFEYLNGEVTERLYPGLGHGVNQDELDRVSEMVDRLVA